jgi:pimeloyl-ACP methyl ester carboxylesterase
LHYHTGWVIGTLVRKDYVADLDTSIARAAKTFFSQRLRLTYLDCGKADAPVLILLHGGRDQCHSWDHFVASLCREWRILTPDLRGHGDSEWSSDGQYPLECFVYDLASLIDQLALPSVYLVGHSLGGNIALRYAALYPEKVRRLMAIEGLGPSPQAYAQEQCVPIAQRLREWIGEQRRLAAPSARKRYATPEAALERMRSRNPRLSHDQAGYLTHTGLIRNEDGTYSWKFDDYMKSRSAIDLTPEELQMLWNSVKCPVSLIYGADSWASNPEKDGRARYFSNATVAVVPGAGHWVQHDQPAQFLALLHEFLRAPG